MYLYYFNEDLTCKSSRKLPTSISEARPFTYISEEYYPPHQVKATSIIDSVVQGIEEVPGPEKQYLHVSVTAPGGGPSGVPSVAQGETATITAEIRNSEDKTSNLLAYSGTIRVPYCKNGVLHGYLRMEFSGGQCAYTLSPQSHHHGILGIGEGEFELLDGYQIQVVGDAKLIVDEISVS